MSAFTALNVEPDDSFDDDVDNTKEIQIEEALKLYQSALKLHAQGPKYYEQAAVAYDALFKSEIFQSPESISEFTRIEENPSGDYETDTQLYIAAELAESGVDGSPSTLPQILYLAYKNHGQFIMDSLKHQVQTDQNTSKEELRSKAKWALERFCQALARDESDTELWRRASRIGTFLGSQAIARYCLEAAVEVDDDPTLGEVEPAGLEEGFAGTQLNSLLKDLSDEVSLSHPIMGPYNKKSMGERMKKFMDPYPFLSDPLLESNNTGALAIRESSASRIKLDLVEGTWSGLGESLWSACMAQSGSAAGVTIELVEEDFDMGEAASTSEAAPQLPPALVHSSSSTQEMVPIVALAPTPPPRKESESGVEASTEPEQDKGPASRKRSQSAAGIQDTPEEETGAQKRSKRIRNRDTGAETPVDAATQYQEALADVRYADSHTFSFINELLEKFGLSDLGTLDSLQDVVSTETSISIDEPFQNTAVRDLRDIMKSWNDNRAALLWSVGSSDLLGVTGSNANAGLLAFLEHSKTGPKKLSVWPAFSPATGLTKFVKHVNEGWMPLQDVVYEYLTTIHRSYTENLWPERMKTTVCRLINLLDAEIYTRLTDEVEESCTISNRNDGLEDIYSMVQMLFELHLDIYANITNPSSVVDFATREKEKNSLSRWAAFADNIIPQRICGPKDELSLRYLWAAAFFVSLADGVSREHVIICWNDMQSLLKECDNPVIELQNNAVMSEISAPAADREISRLTTMDFFMNLFQSDKSDPVGIIETLEPVLEPQSAGVVLKDEKDEMQLVIEDSPQPTGETTSAVPDGLRDMWKFLQSGSTSLRLFLWQRLREAYDAIDYKTKVFSCYLKSIEIIMADFRTSAYVDSSSESRQHSLLTWFRTLDDLLVKTLTLALNEPSAFEIIDDAHIRSSSAAVAQLVRILHSATIFDDGVRVGMTQLPNTAPYSVQGGTFVATMNKLREMQVRSWALLYTLIKDGMAQNQDLFPTQEIDLADYLAAVHHSLGLRKFCKVSNRIFLKMMKVELVRMNSIDPWEDYLGQVLYDLYGLRLGTGSWEIQEHGCSPEALDRRTTLSIANKVIVLASRMSMKDLLKSELRQTIERMQQAIGAAKTSPHLQHNFRNMTEYLKTSINFLRLIQALKGQLNVDSIPVITPESTLADSGWYHLLGMIALTKFRSQKRLSAGATDDLKVAASFFRLQLQFTFDLWETWYRLAQCFDAELEEDVLWSADKINGDRASLNTLQRSAIHCYAMALSTAMRSADASLETASKLSDMYHDFGMRIYSSSREPYGMEAFWLDDYERHFSGPQGMYKKPAHDEMSRFKAWKYAARLFQRALAEKPNYWMNHYMLGKCLWKMYSRAPKEAEFDPTILAARPTMQSVLDAFIKSIETVPKPRDSRSEPIIEPHYKIMSIVHKLVMSEELGTQEAVDLLQRQPYAIRKGAPELVTDLGMWRQFILESIRHLRNADKSNWHHRMIYRSARIICPSSKPDELQARAARAELKDTMFTKTMVVQVWKPEYERPGRHCVYMERYVRWMIHLLLQLDDKLNMEALVKRVRKKQADYYHFNEVWNECCSLYLRLLRRCGNISPNQDDVLKSSLYDDFSQVADVFNNWSNDTESSHPALECLREAIELKRLNANLMKPAPIDDLIADAYATLYLQVGVHLPRPPPKLQSPPPGDPDARSQGPMSLNSMLSNVDGTADPIPIQFAPQAPDSGRSRTKGVSRREILRRAEAAVTRIPEPAKPFSGSRPRLSDQSTMDGFVNRSTLMDSAPEARAPAALREEEKEGEEQSSAPGSLHDSADDESDLSDVPEDMEEEPPSLLPDISGSAEHSEGEGRSGDGSIGGKQA